MTDTDKTKQYEALLRECLILLKAAFFAHHKDTARANALYDRIKRAIYEK